MKPAGPTDDVTVFHTGPQRGAAKHPPARGATATSLHQTIESQIKAARSGSRQDKDFSSAVDSLLRGARDGLADEDFRARAAAMATAVRSNGNRKVPATLIRALFDRKHQGLMSAQQLQIALHELTKARFADGMDASDIARYLNIVGKAANHPDERVYVLRPLAAMVKDLSSRDMPAPGAPQLQVSLDAASEYWPSWRLSDTDALLAQGAELSITRLQVDRPTASQLATLYRRAVDQIDKGIHEQRDHAQVKAALQQLAARCGDLHLGGFAQHLRETCHADDASIGRYRVVMEHIAQMLRDERSSFEFSIRPFINHIAKPRQFGDSRLHNAAMASLCVVAGWEDGGKGHVACWNSLQAVLARNLTRDEQAAYDAAVRNAKQRAAPAAVTQDADAVNAAREGLDQPAVPYL